MLISLTYFQIFLIREGGLLEEVVEQWPEQTTFSLSPASSSAFERKAPSTHCSCGTEPWWSSLGQKHCVWLFSMFFIKDDCFSGFQEPSRTTFWDNSMYIYMHHRGYWLLWVTLQDTVGVATVAQWDQWYCCKTRTQVCSLACGLSHSGLGDLVLLQLWCRLWLRFDLWPGNFICHQKKKKKKRKERKGRRREEGRKEKSTKFVTVSLLAFDRGLTHLCAESLPGLIIGPNFLGWVRSCLCGCTLHRENRNGMRLGELFRTVLYQLPETFPYVFAGSNAK